nr:MAG TPA: hypothetical protein [Caudoviricetes sp.]DAK62115.1 MAG TPA: hypothetical protein [Caudoviricetes sp.]
MRASYASQPSSKTHQITKTLSESIKSQQKFKTLI